MRSLSKKYKKRGYVYDWFGGMPDNDAPGPTWIYTDKLGHELTLLNNGAISIKYNKDTELKEVQLRLRGVKCTPIEKCKYKLGDTGNVFEFEPVITYGLAKHAETLRIVRHRRKVRDAYVDYYKVPFGTRQNRRLAIEFAQNLFAVLGEHFDYHDHLSGIDYVGEGDYYAYTRCEPPGLGSDLEPVPGTDHNVFIDSCSDPFDDRCTSCTLLLGVVFDISKPWTVRIEDGLISIGKGWLHPDPYRYSLLRCKSTVEPFIVLAVTYNVAFICSFGKITRPGISGNGEYLNLGAPFHFGYAVIDRGEIRPNCVERFIPIGEGNAVFGGGT